ncbi:MAG: MoaD/ThiS family protein [Planctomycetaceae bacterium]
MHVTIEYAAQAKRAAGIAAERVELDAPCSVSELLRRRADARGTELRILLFGDDGRLQPSLLVFVGDRQIRGDEADTLRVSEGDVLTVMSPISGG